MKSIALRIANRIERRAKMTQHAISADSFLVSYPKSGRTWLRYMLAHYFAAVSSFGEPVDLHNMFALIPNFDLDPVRGIPAFRAARRNGPMPRIWVSHHNFHWRLFFHKPVILIVRDPRDVIVSSYFHAVRHKHRFDGNMLDFMKHESQGLPAMCRYLNGWAGAVARRPHCVLSYEALSKNTEQELRSTLAFLNCPIDVSALNGAVRAGSFAAMQELELTEGIPGHDYDRSDSESLRMRRGQAGGYRDYLDKDMIEIVEKICARKLSPTAKDLLARSGIELA
jgi:hypothetical protein